MKLLVIGNGGREHTIIRKLKENPQVKEILCCSGNGGISKDARCFPIKPTDIDGVCELAKREAVDFAVVAPDDPLVLGMVDALTQIGIPCFGPTADAAVIEGSKVFSKNLMKKYGIPTAGYEVFDDPAQAMQYIQEKNEFPIVIKADGLALGKGVLIVKNLQEAKDAIHSMMEEHIFGTSGSTIVVEEFLTGPEVSVLAFTDGKTMCPMVSSMDHKRALDNDEGLNTGGMGTVAPNPCYTPDIAKECMEKIFLPTMDAMNKEGRTFKGCLYFGLMLTPKGPYVIEYNCRFGDPETQVVLEMLDSDLLTIMQAVSKGELARQEIRFRDGCAACVVLASGGYPQHYETGYEICGLDENGQAPGVSVYHAGTKFEDGKFLTAGGRVLGVTATGENLPQALQKAYAAADAITFKGKHCRRDIGARALKALEK